MKTLKQYSLEELSKYDMVSVSLTDVNPYSYHSRYENTPAFIEYLDKQHNIVNANMMQIPPYTKWDSIKAVRGKAEYIIPSKRLFKDGLKYFGLIYVPIYAEFVMSLEDHRFNERRSMLSNYFRSKGFTSDATDHTEFRKMFYIHPSDRQIKSALNSYTFSTMMFKTSKNNTFAAQDFEILAKYRGYYDKLFYKNLVEICTEIGIDPAFNLPSDIYLYLDGISCSNFAITYFSDNYNYLRR